MKRFLLFVCICAFLLTGCNSDELHYPETEAIVTADDGSPPVDPYGTVFTYTASEDTQNTVFQRSGYFSYGIFVVGDYLYYNNGNMLYRYNTKTGNITSACADPLCLHDSYDCPFFNGLSGSGAMYSGVFNNKIYYKVKELLWDKKNHQIEGEKLHSRIYDIETQTVTESKRQYDQNGPLNLNDYCTENEEYYYSMAANEDGTNWQMTLLCYDVKTQKNRVVRSVSYENPMAFFSHDEENLYYCDTVSIGKMNRQTGKKTAIYQGECSMVNGDDQYFYFFRASDDSLWRLSREGGEPEPLEVEGVQASTFLTDNYIYYRYDNSFAAGKDGAGNILYVDGQDIWRMKKDGSEKERVFNFVESPGKMSLSRFVVIGNYIYGSWVCFDESGNKTSTAAEKTLLRIDISTGEFYYIAFPK